MHIFPFFSIKIICDDVLIMIFLRNTQIYVSILLLRGTSPSLFVFTRMIQLNLFHNYKLSREQNLYSYYTIKPCLVMIKLRFKTQSQDLPHFKNKLNFNYRSAFCHCTMSSLNSDGYMLYCEAQFLLPSLHNMESIFLNSIYSASTYDKYSLF